MDASKIESFVSDKWDAEIVPQLVDYIRIPNKSPMFDPDWEAHGHMERAVELIKAHVRSTLRPEVVGDIAEIRDSRIYIRGRMKDIVVMSNGEKIPPVDIEARTAKVSIPGILESIGQPIRIDGVPGGGARFTVRLPELAR